MWLSVYLHISVWVYLCLTHGGPLWDKRQNKARKKEKENRREKLTVNSMLPPNLVLVVQCLHCAHIHGGKVLSCLVWPDLTFSLSRHVSSFPIPIKISILPLPVSLPLAQTCITFSVPLCFRQVLLNLFSTLTYTPMLSLKYFLSSLSLLTHSYFLYFLLLHVRLFLW